MDRCHWIQFHWRKTKLKGNCKLFSIRFVGSYFWWLGWDCRFFKGVLAVVFTWGISQVCGNKVRRSILIGCWKKAAITAIEDFKNFSVCPILNWMDVSRYRIYRFTPDVWLSRFGWQDSWVAWGLCPLGDEDISLKLQTTRCKMLSLEIVATRRSLELKRLQRISGPGDEAGTQWDRKSVV